LRKAGRYDEAVSAYDRAIAIEPENSEAYYGIGRAFQLTKDFVAAAHSFDAAIKHDPEFGEAYAARGQVLYALKLHDKALASFERAIALRPKQISFQLGKAHLLEELWRVKSALENYDHALRLDPQSTGAHAGRARMLSALQRFEEAMASIETAIALQPNDESLYATKAECLDKMGRKDEAIAVLSEALERLNTSEVFRFRAASLGAHGVFDAAPQVYVRNLFDGYAERFERHLIGTLQYSTPEKMYQQFERFFLAGPRDCLDLGCGTGLGAAAYRTCIGRAVGVDLSKHMLEKAKAKDLYEDLVCSDVIAFLEETTKAFDLVLCIDVIVYIGALEPLFAGVKRVLRPGGVFAFSTEVAEDEALRFELKKSKRYGHSREYLAELAQRYGFTVSAIERDVIRRESNADLEGYIAHLVSL
jgi:predicted TPR repeat methyltransferase